MKLSIRITTNRQGGYTAICPSLPGCMSRGDTRDEARKNIDQAICGYLAALGDFFPEQFVRQAEVIEA